MATVLSDDGEWVYHTYTWEHISIEPTDGVVLYGISNGRIIFLGELADMLAVWDTENY